MSKNVKIGIVGAKFAGGFHTDIWKTLPGAEVAAVVDLSEEARAEFQKKYGIQKTYGDYRELIKDPDIDVVDICVPNFLHAEIAAAALSGGKDVICEKPFATTREDAEKVLEAQAKSGRRFFYAEDWLFAPALQRAEKILKDGGIGKPFFFKGKECHSGSHSPFAKKIRFCGGGSLIHLGIHPVGLFHYLLGMPIQVTGLANGGLEENFLHKDFEGEDWGLGILHFPGGERALVEGNYITTGGMDDIIEIYGAEGLIKVELTFGSPLSVFSKKGIDYAVEKAEFTHGWTRPAVNENESLGYKNELSHFLACLKGEERQHPGTTVLAGYNVFCIIEALYRSNREGKTIQMKEESL